jgi:two-component system, OmpR family, KDP operon response regulator KdpE
MPESGPRVLIVDDEAPIRRFLQLTLSADHYSVFEASNGKEAVSQVTNVRPDLIILDLGLPDMDGNEVVRLIRTWSHIPIIILSVRGAEQDKIEALDAGADDYLTKPFSTGELLARVRATLRRFPQPENEPVLSFGELQIDLPGRCVTLATQEVQLTPTEYDLLRLLAVHAGRVLTQRQILKEVWGPGYETEYHILHVNVSNLRQKIEKDPSRPSLIITEPGVGYRLKPE